MTLHGVQFDSERLGAFCRKHHVGRLSVFGSVLREDFRSDSDVDVLVEFAPDAHVSLFDLGGMLMELREMLGREVDLRTPEELSQYFRDRVLKDARVLCTT